MDFKFQEETNRLFNEQIQDWPLAKTNFDGLKSIQVRSFEFDGFAVDVQFNPERIRSSAAKVDAKTIADRPCFLCARNRPSEQRGVNFGSYTMLINPFPIFPRHFTIPRQEHTDQRILPYFTDMLLLARELEELLIFYNGPQCGASAPDHMHFQAGNIDFLPLICDYKRLKTTNAQMRESGNDYAIYLLNNYLRTVLCIESATIAAAKEAFELIYHHLEKDPLTEPMMNIVSVYDNNLWKTFILPRGAFRPWQFTAEGEKQLLISPATVEMGGIFITPIESHFHRINKDDIVNILAQVTLKI